MPTIQDVARAAGVSTGTVSATINGTARVSPALAERVHEAIRAVGYHPNALARSLKTGSSRTLGLIVPDITNPFFTAVIHSVENAAQAGGYSVILCNSDNDPDKERTHYDLLRSRMVDGIILAPTGEASGYGWLLDRNRLPIVIFDRMVDGAPADAVVVDAEDATYGAIRYLIGLGHRRIGYIGGQHHLSPGQARLRGFRRAHADSGVPVDEALIRYGGARREDAYAAAMDLLVEPYPTAVFASNNILALALMWAVQARGLRCPDDISVALFDDFEWASVFHPRLTTIAQPTDVIGSEALRLLLARIRDGRQDGRAATPAQRVHLAAELIIRDSTASPRPG